jgi:hypothetical protein
MELKLEELYIVCSRCKGQKNVTEVQGGANGGPGMGATRWSGPCPDCQGQGGKLTPAGEVLAQFMGCLKSMHRL